EDHSEREPKHERQHRKHERLPPAIFRDPSDQAVVGQPWILLDRSLKRFRGRWHRLGWLVRHRRYAPRSRSARYVYSSARGMRTCSIVSRSRTVTALSSRESKSMVTQNGVPISS